MPANRRKHRKKPPTDTLLDERYTPVRDDQLTAEVLSQITKLLPPDALQELNPRERIFLSARLCGASLTQAAACAGMSGLPVGVLGLLDGRVMERVERSLQLSEIIGLMGISDFAIAHKISDLMHNSRSPNVQFQAVKLAAELKGHLNDTEQTLQATEIHLHVMQTGDKTEQGSSTPRLKPVVEVSHLIPGSNEPDARKNDREDG